MNRLGIIIKHFYEIGAALALMVCFAMPLGAKVVSDDQESALLNNLPRVALLVKEQYVDPNRIKPDAMFASILESLESKITKLVITLPKSLEDVLERSRAAHESSAGESLGAAPVEQNKAGQPSSADRAPGATAEATGDKRGATEDLVLDLGGTKKSFVYEPQRSIWGMVFKLRDIFKFVEQEAKVQELAKRSNQDEEPIDWEKIENGAINAMLSTLDPHSIYLEPKFARDLTLTTKGEFGGIGIVISVRDNYLTVISPIDGTPASKAGVKAKDRIIKIDDESAINMDLNDAVNILRGKPNSTVRITVQRPSTSKDMEFSLKRAIIKVDSVTFALLSEGVGYLRIKAFQGNTASDVKDAILAMKKKSQSKMSGLVLDLRGNPGGLLREAVDVSSLFLDGGEVVSTRGFRDDSRQVEVASAGEIDAKLKIVVLVDGGSASASEIVAGAIKSGGPEAGRGVVVGEPTFGKGSVQILFDFSNQNPLEAAALKLTIAEYFGPNSQSIQNVGVQPDVLLSAIYASKPEEISLFPEKTRREVDLEGHLLSDKSSSSAQQPKDEPLASIEYLSPPPDEEVAEYGKVKVDNLKKDFAITVAQGLIEQSKSAKRSDLLGRVGSVKDDLEKKEHKKITESLARFGIDWSDGVSDAKGAIKAWVSENKGVRSGEKLKTKVKVKNIGKEILFQVHGITHSKTPLFDQKELLFGKLLPGQEIEREVEFDIPKDVVSRKDLMTVELRDHKREKVLDLDMPIEIHGLKRPRFAHMAYIDDSKRGNGDGGLQQGEDVDLTLWLKNIGDGTAFEPTVLLKNDSGTKVFLKNGRFQSKELLPGQQTSMNFSFRVKEPSDSIDFEVQMFDGQMHDLWRKKLTVDLSKKRKSKNVSKLLSVRGDSAPLLNNPAGDGKVLATVKSGLAFKALKEIDGYYLVKADSDLVGYIKKDQVKTVSKSKSKKNNSAYYSIQYDEIPANVLLSFGDASGLSSSDSGHIVARIKDSKSVSSVLLYVNGKKVLYRDMTQADGAQKIDHLIHLKPGVNVISLFARQDALFGQRENITVYYDADGKVAKALKLNSDKKEAHSEDTPTKVSG